MAAVTGGLSRFDAIRGRRVPDWLITLLLLVVFVAVRLPFRSEFLVNWDAVNFALGIESFDLSHHQPHAPGYIGYVALGRLLAGFAQDANGALTLLSAVAGGVLPATAYLLARRFLDRRYAILSAVLLGTSPVVWYYSSVALTYIVSAALTVPFVWAAVTARQEESRRHLFMAAVLLASVGAIRQTDLVMLLPLFLYASWRFPRRTWLRAGALLAAVSALWLVPLLLVAGGLTRYLELSAELAQLAGGSTWALAANPVGWAQNIALVGVGVLFGLNVGLLAVPVCFRSRMTGLAPFGSHGRRMMLLWAAPALATYLLIHTGQIGYVLLILPAMTLWVGSVAQSRAGVEVRDRVPIRRWRLVPSGAVAVVVLNTAAFVFVPQATSTLVGMERGERVARAMSVVVSDGGVAERTRQYDLVQNDRYWDRVVEFVESFDPDETVILTTPTSGGSFRHLGYYLEDYRILGVGFDLSGRFGYLFTAFEGENDYSISGLRSAEPVLELPEGTRWVIVADRAIQGRLTGVDPDRRLRVGAGADPVAFQVPAESSLVFYEIQRDRSRLVVLPAGTPNPLLWARPAEEAPAVSRSLS